MSHGERVSPVIGWLSLGRLTVRKNWERTDGGVWKGLFSFHWDLHHLTEWSLDGGYSQFKKRFPGELASVSLGGASELSHTCAHLWNWPSIPSAKTAEQRRKSWNSSEEHWSFKLRKFKEMLKNVLPSRWNQLDWMSAAAGVDAECASARPLQGFLFTKVMPTNALGFAGFAGLSPLCDCSFKTLKTFGSGI